MVMRNGKSFDFNHPEASEFTIKDIARSLSNMCCFAGHTKDFYSVAQRSVILSQMVPEADAMYALLYQSHQAFTGSIPTELRNKLMVLGAEELKIRAVVMERFGLSSETPESVVVASEVLLSTERRDVLEKSCPSSPAHPLKFVKPLRHAITSWFPSEAYRHYLSRFAALSDHTESGLVGLSSTLVY